MVKLEASPRQRLDKLVPFLRVVWEPWCRKQSYGWQWIPYSHSIPEIFLQWVDPDRNAKRRNGWWSGFWQTNFGWRTVAWLQPAWPTELDQSYQLGFVSREGGVHKKEICTCIVKGEVGALVGPDSVAFFAVSYPSRSPVQLHLVRMTSKLFLPDNIPLL